MIYTESEIQELKYRINFIERWCLTDDRFKEDFKRIRDIVNKQEAIITPIKCIVPPYIAIENPLFYFKCPSCNNKLTGKSEPEDMKPYYCQVCGQKIIPQINEETYDSRNKR